MFFINSCWSVSLNEINLHIDVNRTIGFCYFRHPGMDSHIVLVTGGSGFLGQHVVKHLDMFCDDITEIRVLDIRPYKKNLGNKRFKFYIKCTWQSHYHTFIHLYFELHLLQSVAHFGQIQARQYDKLFHLRSISLLLKLPLQSRKFVQ